MRWQFCSLYGALQIGYGPMWILTHINSDSVCYLSLSVAASWALALHMAASEQFICAICSQLGVAAFVGTVSHDNMSVTIATVLVLRHADCAAQQC